MENPRIHITDVHSFKDCRRRWHYSSPLRLNLAPRHVPTYFLYGRLMHDGIEQYYQGSRDPCKLYEAAVIAEMREVGRLDPMFLGTPEYDALRNELMDGRYVLQHYMLYAQDADDFEMVHPERKVVYDYDDWGVTFSGRFDGVIKRKDGSLWLKEFKTAASLPTDLSYLLLDEQASLYLWLARQIYQSDIKGVVYTFIKKKAPTIPTLLKKGGLSQAKNQDTTLKVYWNALLHYKLDPRPYREFLQYLANKPNNFFVRHQVRRSKTELKSFMRDLRPVVEEMLNPDTPTYPTPSQINCRRCTYFGPCAVRQSNPGMEEAMLRTEFIPSRGR